MTPETSAFDLETLTLNVLSEHAYLRVRDVLRPVVDAANAAQPKPALGDRVAVVDALRLAQKALPLACNCPDDEGQGMCDACRALLSVTFALEYAPKPVPALPPDAEAAPDLTQPDLTPTDAPPLPAPGKVDTTQLAIDVLIAAGLYAGVNCYFKKVRDVLDAALDPAPAPAPAPVALKPGDKVRLLPGACKNASIHITPLIKDGDIGKVTDEPCNPISKVVRIGDNTWFICTADLELVAPAPPDAEAAATSPTASLVRESPYFRFIQDVARCHTALHQMEEEAKP
jgi:hypothetical protein